MSLNIAIHKNILVNILKDIFTNPDIGPYVGFKGGTAVLLFYKLPRFSVDLDFDLLDINKQDEIYNLMISLLEQYGKVKPQKKRYSLFFLLVYKDKLEGAQNIKVEINKRKFGSTYEIKQYLGIPMKVMVKKDITAHKLVAMHERLGKTNRDIFDVWFFLKNNWPINREIIKQRTDMSYKEFLNTCITNLEKLSNRNILSGIGELVTKQQKNWVKSDLKNETVFLLKLTLSNEL